MFTEKELEAYKAKDNAQKAERERVKKEMAIRVIDANNKLRAMVKSFQDYVEKNHAQLIGKKLFLVDGGCSKVMKTFFEAWLSSLEIELTNWDSVYFSMGSGASSKLNISLTVFGGQSRMNNPLEVDTYYNKDIQERIWDIIEIDTAGYYDDYDMSERFSRDFDYDSYMEASKNIAELEEEIKRINIIIGEQNKNIPHQLREK